MCRLEANQSTAHSWKHQFDTRTRAGVRFICSRGAARVVNCRSRASKSASQTQRTREQQTCECNSARSTMDRFVARVHLRGFQSPRHSYTLKQGTCCFGLTKLSCDRAGRFSYSRVDSSAKGHRCDHGWAVGLLKHARPPRTFKLRRVSSTQCSSNDDESICEFVSKSICYGTSATLPVLERNREMTKPQKMEQLAVRSSRREIRKTKIARA